MSHGYQTRTWLTIADTGSGMSVRQLAATQEPFRSSKRDGTWLGLKIARTPPGTRSTEVSFTLNCISRLAFSPTVTIMLAKELDLLTATIPSTRSDRCSF